VGKIPTRQRRTHISNTSSALTKQYAERRIYKKCKKE
jgi:hypothetical protein